MANELPYFNFYPNDFLTSENVTEMDAEQVGVYIMLLAQSWISKNPGYIPGDETRAAKWGRISVERWREISAGVLSAFVKQPDGSYLQPRLKLEYDKSTALHEARRRGGAATKGIPKAPTYAPPPDRSAPKRSTSKLTWSEADGWGEIPEPTRKAWAEAHPGIDIDTELAKAHSWLLVNITRRPKNPGQFFNNWLNRATPSQSSSKLVMPEPPSPEEGLALLKEAGFQFPQQKPKGANNA
jgi:uncharacterized protein YdaU (DUF1376 family)